MLFPSMRKKNYSEAIRDRIEKARAGTLFVMSDFADIAPNNAANRVVLRLSEDGKLRQIVRGVYQKPCINDFLGEAEEPGAEAVAEAIARKNGWIIRPDGDTALNLLGLSTQVPSHWVYLSDGPYKCYTYGGGVIELKHSANRLFGRLSSRAALVVQAFRALGEKGLTDEFATVLRKRFSSDELARISKETIIAPSWIHEAIEKLKGENNA